MGGRVGGWWLDGGKVVGGGEWLWMLVAGGYPVGNAPLSSCNFVDMSKLVRTYIYIYIYIHILKKYFIVVRRPRPSQIS